MTSGRRLGTFIPSGIHQRLVCWCGGTPFRCALLALAPPWKGTAFRCALWLSPHRGRARLFAVRCGSRPTVEGHGFSRANRSSFSDATRQCSLHRTHRPLRRSTMLRMGIRFGLQISKSQISKLQVETFRSPPRRGTAIIARRFSAGSRVQRFVSPVGTTEYRIFLRRVNVGKVALSRPPGASIDR
jgi:hypothetical protein